MGGDPLEKRQLLVGRVAAQRAPLINAKGGELNQLRLVGRGVIQRLTSNGGFLHLPVGDQLDDHRIRAQDRGAVRVRDMVTILEPVLGGAGECF